MQSVEEPQVISCLACCHYKQSATSSPVSVCRCDSTGVSLVADWSTVKRAEHWDLPRNGLQAVRCSAAPPGADGRSGAGHETMSWSCSSRCCSNSKGSKAVLGHTSCVYIFPIWSKTWTTGISYQLFTWTLNATIPSCRAYTCTQRLIGINGLDMRRFI